MIRHCDPAARAAVDSDALDHLRLMVIREREHREVVARLFAKAFPVGSQVTFPVIGSAAGEFEVGRRAIRSGSASSVLIHGDEGAVFHVPIAILLGIG